MSQQYTLNWVNTSVVANPNSTGQRTLYRYRLVGGTYISTGFTPSNDLPTSAITSDSPVLDDNKVVQFIVDTVCSIGGPIPNDNGVVEVIGFACIAPVITEDYLSSQATINVTGLDITKARFTLRRASDNVIMGVPVVAVVAFNACTASISGLAANTNYYWQVELYAIVNSVEVISSDPAYLGSVCSPYPFTTVVAPTCNPVASAGVASIEI